MALCGTAHAQPLLPVPTLTARVIDQTGTLDPSQLQALEAKIAAFEQKKGSQIVVLMVPTTAPEDIASYANRVANAWRIGRREVGDGLLVIVAKNDRKMRIEVAKTLEGAVPDIAAGQIIDQQMKPAFRNNDFAGGIDAAVDQLIGRITGEALPDVGPKSQGDQGLFDVDWEDLAIFLFFAVVIGGPILRGIFGSKLGPLLTGGVAGGVGFVVTSSLVIAGVAGLLALIYTLIASATVLGGNRRGGGGYIPGGWGGGGGGGSSGGGWSGGSSSSGGGFSSGGGGDFGGGGASGDW